MLNRGRIVICPRDSKNYTQKRKHMLEPQELSLVHPGYAEYVYRWDYYMRSYMGAEEYRDGAYLRKYLAEDQAPGNAYRQRLMDTAFQNHPRQVVDAYRSFIFRNPPTRTLGRLVDDVFVRQFINNADLDGTDLNAFMREVHDMMLIYGGAWVGMDRPAYQVESAAEEEALGIRSFATLYSPTNVRNWRYEKQINGKNKLTYLQVVEDEQPEYDIIRVWYPDRIEVYKVTKKDFINTSNYLTAGDVFAKQDAMSAGYGKVVEFEEYENPLGYIPFIHVFTDASFHKGVGTSAIGDVCDISREIYNLTSEMYESIRLSSHPSIVAEPSAQLNGGSGSIITVDESTNIQPYLLQPTGATVESILGAMEQKVNAIEDMTHLAAIKARKGPQSGISLQVEREMLNAKLSDNASVLEKAEKKIWKMFFDWQNIEQDEEFEVYYEKRFDLRDKHNELNLYKQALEAVPHDSFQHYMHDEIARLLIDDESDLQMILDSIAKDHEEMNIQVPGEDTENSA